MIKELADQDPHQESRRRHPAIDDGRRNRRRRDGLAGFTGVLRADMPVDEEPGRLDVQLFGDIFADLDQVLTALPALAGLGLVPVFDAGEMVR